MPFDVTGGPLLDLTSTSLSGGGGLGMNPLSAGILALGSLLGGLFGSKSKQTVTQPSRMDPLYGILSPMMMGNAMKSMDWLNGWGGSKYFDWNPLIGSQGKDARDYFLNRLRLEMPSLISQGFRG